MKMNLDAVEIRVLGALMEKELTTPENYPLSLNALVSACNQKSNRDPVLALTEAEVERTLASLSARGLARLTTTGGRVARYVHSVAEKLGLSAPVRAVLAELMLRGPQTAGELRNRADRMAAFADLGAVEEAVGELLRAAPPLAMRLPRQAGRKEQRYAQLLAGTPELSESDVSDQSDQSDRSDRSDQSDRSDKAEPKLVRLESDVATLREEVAALRQEIEALIAAF